VAGSHTQDTAPGAPFANAAWPNKNTATPIFQFVLMLRGILRNPENSGDRFQRGFRFTLGGKSGGGK
jgi:hypothetical protein